MPEKEIETPPSVSTADSFFQYLDLLKLLKYRVIEIQGYINTEKQKYRNR